MVDNIPVYRAKSRTTDLYEYGHLFKSQKATFIIPICKYNEEIGEFDFIKVFEPIFEDTIAIHFPNMLASDSDRYFSNGEKDLRIFVSLQEDGKGSDMLIEDGKYDDGFNPVFIPYFRKSSLGIFDLPKTSYGEYQLNCYKILGIQQ